MGFILDALGGSGGTKPTYNAAQGMAPFQVMGTNSGLGQAQNLSLEAMGGQQAFLNALGPSGLNAGQAGIFGQQQQLANQYQGLATGQGPNLAQSQLAQNTGQNMQQQAALMGSARGAQSNPGLVTRQAAQAGGNLQQQAVGQSATLGAQQQLAAMQQQGALQNQMAGLASQGVGQQQQALSQFGTQAQGYQGLYQTGVAQQNQNLAGAQAANVPMYTQALANEQKNSAGIMGGLMNAAGGLLMLAGGGQVPAQEPQSILGSFGSAFQDTDPGVNSMVQGFGTFGKGLRSALTPTPTTIGQAGGNDLPSNNIVNTASQGGKINGKANTQGDSKSNDTVPAMLSPGEVVIPRSHINDPDKAAQFLNSLMGWNLKAGKA